MWSARALAERHLTGDVFNVKCPCCEEYHVRGENVGHILLTCKRWRVQREQYMGQLVREATAAVEREHEDEWGHVQGGIIVGLLLGGMYRGVRLESWLPCKEASTSRGQVKSDEPLNCGAFQVARFLQSVEGQRAEVLGKFRVHDNSTTEPMREGSPSSEYGGTRPVRGGGGR